MTTREPGARLDFTQGLRSRPRSTAFFARRPAATITCGFDVFVQDVIAAITTQPWPSSNSRSPSETRARAGSGSATATAGAGGAASSSWPGSTYAGGSEAGKLSAEASSFALP